MFLVRSSFRGASAGALRARHVTSEKIAGAYSLLNDFDKDEKKKLDLSLSKEKLEQINRE